MNMHRRNPDMNKGRLEKELVEPYVPNKIVPPEYIKDVLEEANKDFPLIDFEYNVPHTLTVEEYRNRWENSSGR